MSHLVFYDGECPLCLNSVKLILKWDQEKKFVFAPLGGKTAQIELAELFEENPKLDSLVLIENYQTKMHRLYVEGEAALRVAWDLGGWWKMVGILSYLPGWTVNWIYRLVASNRMRIFRMDRSCLVENEETKGRFLE